MKGKPFNIAILIVYAWTLEYTEDEGGMDKFYSTLNNAKS